MSGTVEAGREAFERGAWHDALDRLAGPADAGALEPHDLVRLAMAAYLTRVDGWDTWCVKAYQQCLARDERPLAARCGFWLGFGLLDEGQAATGSGWLIRVQKLLDEEDVDCAERGLLLLPVALGHLERGEPALALDVCRQTRALGERFGDPDVSTIGRLGVGQALVDLGDRAAGLALIDEVMVAVVIGEVSAPVAGLVACGAIETCQRMFELARAMEWTSALSRWCDAQPELAPYRGQCLVHRAEILRLHGAWPEAAVAAEAARQRLAGTPAAGDALYEQAELHRLRGDLACAEEAYRAASHAGRDPQPGLALLRLAQGDVVTALAAVTRVVDEAGISTARARMLGPFAEVSLAAGDVAAARRAVDELMASASGADTPYLDGVAAALMGRVELAEGDARAAIVTLRRAWRVWHELGAPFEAAQVRVAVAAACRTLGDADGAAMELDAATRVFDELGAAPDHARIAESAAPPSSPGRLTGREVEVLRLVAGGKSNRAAAGELFISEKTVARHLSNIYAKLGVASRSAAAAWAYEHGLMHLSA